MHTIYLKGAGTRKGECRHFYDCLQPLETIMNYGKLLKKDLIALLAKKESEVQALTNKVEELTLALQRNTGVMEQRPLINESREKVLSFVQNKELLLRFQRAFGTKNTIVVSVLMVLNGVRRVYLMILRGMRLPNIHLLVGNAIEVGA